jgi:transcriptional accessory protein Tex/SPT6
MSEQDHSTRSPPAHDAEPDMNGLSATDQPPALITPEDAEWIRSATDATLLNRERLHAAYTRFFFEGAPPAEGDDDDDRDDIGDEDDDIDAALRRGRADDEDDDDDDGEDWERIINDGEEQDRHADARRTAAVDIDQGFVDWITYNADRDAEIPVRHADTANIVAHRMEERGLAPRDALRPERLEDLYERERATQTSASLLAGHEVRLAMDEEALWIVQRLFEPGYPLFGLEANVVEVTAAKAEVHRVLDLLAEGLEPAHIAVYFRHLLGTLRSLLWYGTRATDRGGQLATAVDASMPYIVETGARCLPQQLADVHWDANRFKPQLAASNASPSTNDSSKPPTVVVKPGDVRLGRLLWCIAELDGLCRRLENQRQEIIRSLEQLGDVDMLRSLQRASFSTEFQAIIWRQYADWKKRDVTISGSIDVAEATQRTQWSAAVRRCKQALSDFAVAPQDLARALGRETAGATLPLPLHRPKSAEPVAWAAGYENAGLAGGALGDRADEVLVACKRAFIDHLSILPQVRQVAFDAFMAHAVVEVRPVGGNRSGFPRFFSVRELAKATTPIFLRLLEAEASKLVQLDFKLQSEDLMKRLGLREWTAASVSENVAPLVRDAWDRIFAHVAHTVCTRSAFFAERQARSTLRRVAENCHVTETIERLGHLCSEGPYEQTTLRLDGFRDTALWDAAYNTVEAVPVNRDVVSALGKKTATTNGARQIPACGVYRSQGVTHFAFVDRFGNPCEQCRWIDYTATDEGATLKRQQEEELLDRLKRVGPCVFAVAVTPGRESQRAFNDICEFVENAVQILFFTIPVVWHPPTIATASVQSEAAEATMPGATLFHRIAVGVAQSLQNPLHAIARLFDSKHTAKELPVGCDRFRRDPGHANRVYRWMERELSLWMTFSGVDVNAVIVAPAPSTVLQFVAGLGPQRARSLVQRIHTEYGSHVESRRVLYNELRTAETAETRNVTRNALPSLRIIARDTRSSRSNGDLHPLDCTLIPLEWYDAVADALGAGALPSPLKPLIIADWLSRDVAERRVFFDQMLADHTHGSNAYDLPESVGLSLYMYFFEDGSRSIPMTIVAGFIVDELMAPGVSRMPRPYRKVTAERFFEMATNLSFVSAERGRALKGSPADHARLVYRDKDVEGTIQRYLVRDTSVSILVQLSIGVRGTIDSRAIGNAHVRESLEEYAARQRARGNGVPRLGRDEGPREPSLAVGGVVFGTITGVVFDNAEVRLAWRDPPSSAATDMALPNRSRDSRASEAGTLATVELIRRGRKTALGYVRHPQYMEVNRHEAAELLARAEKSFGEFVIRNSQGSNQAFSIDVKVSEEPHHEVLTIPCTEYRNPQGKHVYRIEQRAFAPKADMEYDSVDHIIGTVVLPLNELVRGIRLHRKFFPELEMVRDSLSQQLVDYPGRLAYAITEHFDSKRQAHYAIAYMNAEEHKPRFLGMPMMRGGLGYFGTRGGVVTICRDVSQLIQCFKRDYTERADSAPRTVSDV